MPNTSKLVTRSELRSYMNVGTAATPSYELIGEGFTSMSESKNPKEYSRQYVHESTERTDIIGYAPSIAYSTDMYTNNAVIAKVRQVTDEELVGVDAQVDIVNVDMFDTTTQTIENAEVEVCKAYKRTYAIIPDNKGDGTEALIYSGTFKAVSEKVIGYWNAANNTFTAAD